MFRLPTTKNRRNRRKKVSRSRARRGIVILIVLTLLFMFVLISVTYVMIANRYRVASANYSRAETTGDSPRQEVEESIKVLVRGSTDPRSPLHVNSILEDIYGVRSEVVTISSATDANRGGSNVGLVELTLTTAPRDTEHQYNGRVVTITQGLGREISSRIVSSDLGNNRFYTLPFTDSFGNQVAAASITGSGGVTVLINGREFSGTGAGYNSGTGMLDRANGGIPVAFQISDLNVGASGGENEPYDAPDYNNKFLAYYDLSNGALTGTNQIKPSFFDAATFNYLNTGASASILTDPTKTSQYIFRPRLAVPPTTSPPVNYSLAYTSDFHPNFNGSNPNFATGIWDVDNDMDGIPDSVWIDPGFPVMTTKDGRLYKRLVAYLVLDMDGRVNINAAGSSEQLIAGYTTGTGLAPLAGAPGAVKLPRGSGIGPADINLNLGQATGIGGRGLFEGTTTPQLAGRYGNESLAGTAATPNWKMQLKVFPHGASTDTVADNYPNAAYAPINPMQLRNYAGGPLDLFGHYGCGLDYNGNLVYEGVTGSTMTAEAHNSPYELNMGMKSASGMDRASTSPDNPFSVGELERLLRSTDSDSYSLPNRIDALSQSDAATYSLNVSNNPLNPNRHAVTTVSFDTPVVSPLWGTAYLRHPAGVANLNSTSVVSATGQPLHNQSLVDVLNASMGILPPATPSPQQANLAKFLLPPEVLMGLPMNLNRKLGDGKDSATTPNGIVDEESEVADRATNTSRETQDQTTIAGTAATAHGKNVQLNLLQSEIAASAIATSPPTAASFTTANQNYLVRQQMARYLYTLMMMAKEIGYNFPPTAGDPEGLAADTVNQNELTARRIAQWAINAVEFMDPDNIMTPFEYDVNPFDGWDQNADGIITRDGSGVAERDGTTVPNQRRLVWGSEQPLLLLSEAFAWHDRRVRDSENDDGPGHFRDGNNDGQDTDPNEDDPTMDQALIPRGPGFVELYACFNPLLRYAGNDFFAYDTTTGLWRLNLGKFIPDTPGGATGVPVWRIVVTKSAVGAGAAANDVYDRSRTKPDTFVAQTPQTATANGMTFTTTPAPADTVGYSRTSLLSTATEPNIEIDRIIVFTQENQLSANYSADEKLRMYCYNDTAATAAASLHTFTGDPAIKPNPAQLLFGGQYALLFPNGIGPSAKLDVATNGRIEFHLGGVNDNSPTAQPNGEKGKQYIEVNFANGNPFLNATGTPAIRVFDLTGADQTQPMQEFSALLPIGSCTQPVSTTKPWGANDRVGFSFTEPLMNDYYPMPDTDNPSTGLKEGYGDPANPAGNSYLDNPLDSENGRPLKVDNLLATGTTERYKTVILQRVADPTRPYDPDSNPYITVDWLPVALTVFNGDDRKPTNNRKNNQPLHANWTDANWDPDDANWNKPLSRFSSRQRGMEAPIPNTIPNIWFAESFCDNTSAINPGAHADNNFPYDFSQHQSFGYLNKAFGAPKGEGTIATPAAALAGTGTTANNLYRGSPGTPWPNLGWNNRPYNNALELMRVPASDPGRLFMEFSVDTTTATYYTGTTDPTGIRKPFGHLINFFHSAPNTGTPTSGNFARMFDWVTTPSKFVGTETWLTPANGNGTITDTPTTGLGLLPFQTPYNYVSNYREPGKINLNTLSHPKVFKALMNGWVTDASGATDLSDNLFAEFLKSRNNSGASVGDMLNAPNTSPTFWMNPFRPAATSELVPLPTLAKTGSETTILRPLDATGSRPLFSPTPRNTAANAYNDNAKNAVMSFQPIERLANLTTNKSNVYAIWVTVGYFEVKPNNNTSIYPDGYELGQELGIETGEQQRHRGFALFDRSIPVGFERGQDHNIDRGFLIKRFIE